MFCSVWGSQDTQHAEETQHERMPFAARKPPPPRNSLCSPFFLHYEEKRGPKHKEFAGLGERGGVWEGVMPKFFMFIFGFWFLSHFFEIFLERSA